jgi:hypothetical protein
METQDTYAYEVQIMTLDPSEPEPTTFDIREALEEGGFDPAFFVITTTSKGKVR